MRIIKKILNSAKKRKNTFFGNGFSVENSYGCKWLIDWSNSVDKKMTFRLFENNQINFFLKNVAKLKPDYFLDIGAHGGLYSIILKNYYPYLEIFSFEPDRQNRYQLYSNLFLNELEKKITVFDFGLSDKFEEVSFGIRKKGNRGGKTIKPSGDEKIIVKPLDKVLLEKKKKYFLKIDVEGHELHVLKGAKKILKNNSCLIQVEILKENGFDELNNLMKSFGYKYIHKLDDYYYSNFDVNF